MDGPAAVHVTALGTGTTIHHPHHGPACFCVQVGSVQLLMDVGPGALQRAVTHGIDPLETDIVIVSHRHLDHCADLASLLFARTVSQCRRPLHLIGGRGLTHHLERLAELWGPAVATPLCGPLRVTELPLDQGADLDLNEQMTLRTAPAAHSRGALHLRLDAHGHTVVFSGDTGPSAALKQLSQRCDLLIVECGSPRDTPIPGHLRDLDIVDLVEAARPAQVWMTHFYPGSHPARAVTTVAATGCPTLRAHDGLRWQADA